MTDSRPALSRSTVDRDAATREDGAALDRAWSNAKVLVLEDGLALVDGTSLVLVEAADAPHGAERLYLATHVRCPRCGAPTHSAKGGAVRICEADASTHFPRTDPAVIVLVTDGADRAVLGRSAIWPPRRYSTLAGFVEPGESAEQAVVREVAEEAGIAVRQVVYRGSQPWPFPASLMLGYRAVCDPDAEPVPQDGELADAGWFTRQQLRDAGGWEGGPGPVLLPPPVSIAYRLITEWVAEGPSRP